MTSEATAPAPEAVAAEPPGTQSVEVWVSEAELVPGEVAVIMSLALDLT